MQGAGRQWQDGRQVLGHQRQAAVAGSGARRTRTAWFPAPPHRTAHLGCLHGCCTSSHMQTGLGGAVRPRRRAGGPGGNRCRRRCLGLDGPAAGQPAGLRTGLYGRCTHGERLEGWRAAGEELGRNHGAAAAGPCVDAVEQIRRSKATGTSLHARKAVHFPLSSLAGGRAQPYHLATAIPTCRTAHSFALGYTLKSSRLCDCKPPLRAPCEALSDPPAPSPVPHRLPIMQAVAKAQGPVAAALPAVRLPRPAAAAACRLRAAAPERRAPHDAAARQLAAKATPSGAAAVEQAPAQQVGKGAAG